MPACVANFVKVPVQAPMYGLVLEVASTTTRLPSAAACAAPPIVRPSSTDANKICSTRMAASPAASKAKMLAAIARRSQQAFPGDLSPAVLAAMLCGNPPRDCDQPFVAMGGAEQPSGGASMRLTARCITKCGCGGFADTT